MTDPKRNYSRGVLVRLALVLLAVAILLGLNADFILSVYLRNQPTMTGWIINGGILLLFLFGLARIAALLRRYMREENDLQTFLRALEEGEMAIEVDRQSLIAQRYQAIQALSRRNMPINHAALASVQVARESTALSLPRFVNNILILTGVFGTIVSLSIALVGASNLLGGGQQEPGSMGLVMHGMSTALSTTITAIVCYLVYGYFFLKLTDAQTYLLGRVEQATLLELLPRFSHSGDELVQRVSGLVKGLYEVAELMRTVQADYVTSSSQLHSLISALNQRTKPMNDDLKIIKGLLRDGFRLPEAGPPSH